MGEALMADPLLGELREAVQKLRRTPMPISDPVPLLQRAADEIERLEKENDKLKLQVWGATMSEIERLRAEIARLKDYEWMYRDLCK